MDILGCTKIFSNVLRTDKTMKLQLLRELKNFSCYHSFSLPLPLPLLFPGRRGARGTGKVVEEEVEKAEQTECGSVEAAGGQT